VGETNFTITAAGMAGAVVSVDFKLLVSSSRGPAATGNITQILAKSGHFSGPSTINIGSAQPFDITFPQDIFGSGNSLSYHALLSDHTPLPAWIGFEASTLRFSGITPPTTPTQTSYEILC
jgi:axial budding pattern protein 2